jgi:VWFA-related protein
MPLRQRRLICLVLAGLSAVALRSQTSAPQSGSSTLKTTARLVVVDVVVTDWYGQPMPGLRKEDFHVSEDGKPQTISAFEEHTAKIPAAIKQAALPPNTFSNLPRLETPDSLNVVLLDALNTPIQDQGFVHQQILKYLADMHPGEPIAVFIISTRLRLVH